MRSWFRTYVQSRLDIMERSPLMWAVTREGFVAPIALMLEMLWLDYGETKNLHVQLHETLGCSYVGLDKPITEAWARETVAKARLLLANIPLVRPLCGVCGAEMSLSIGPGRFRSYRGNDGFEIPAYLAFNVCSCGAEWLSDTQVNVLSHAFENERAARRKR
jgi:hypothetical protein